MAWSVDTVESALAALQAGASVRTVAARVGVPEGTVTNWQRGRIPRRVFLARSGLLCRTCGDQHNVDALPAPTYAYLLGLYLGDGCLARQSRTWSLRIAMDSIYPHIVEEARAAVARLSPTGRVWVSTPKRDRSVVICSYAKRWICLFPQHGPGKKQDRRIVLADWQQRLVDAAPGQLLRGLIHSDGWRGLNRVVVKGRPYAYPRYQFSSRSADIRRIFTDTCDALGIAWRPWGRWHISVARRDAVARLDAFVGPKA
jgi:hypothetical protein